MNRLKLDWSLETSEQRSEFINKYLTEIDFEPNPTELETIGSYVLWGRDEDGKNCVQRKEIELPSRYSTWNKKEPESLDALAESPTFNEAQLNSLETAVPLRAKKETFDRERALRAASDTPHLLNAFKTLFHEIDLLDLTLNYYDIEHGKRKDPPREELLARTTTSDHTIAQQSASHLTQRNYLKKRHELVELRTQQYTLSDFCLPTRKREVPPTLVQPQLPPIFGADIVVMPLGLCSENPRIFVPEQELRPALFNEVELRATSKHYWHCRDLETKLRPTDLVFDFRKLEHLYNLFLQLEWLRDATLDEDVYSTTGVFLETLNYYKQLANLTDIHEDILMLKAQGLKNQPVADRINEKYGKAYTANYISTLFRQRIIVKINEAAKRHEKTIRSLPFPEEFKVCCRCGRTFLRDPDFFVHKSRASDGLSGSCKICDQEERKKKKEAKK